MTLEDRRSKRVAFQHAQTLHRAYHELYYPVPTSGSRAALPFTDEASTELARLAAAVETARVTLEEAMRARG